MEKVSFLSEPSRVIIVNRPKGLNLKKGPTEPEKVFGRTEIEARGGEQLGLESVTLLGRGLTCLGTDWPSNYSIVFFLLPFGIFPPLLRAAG